MTASVERRDTWRRNPCRIVLWSISTGLLLTPAIAMQFTGEVKWDAFDFGFAAVLLFGSAGLIDLAMRKAGSPAYRLATGLAVLTAFLLIWINGAVGIIGNEDNPANLIYLGEILVAAAGAVIARFEAGGMARALFAAAGVQALVTLAGLFVGFGAQEPPGLVGILMLNGFFFALWLLSGGLFARAARDQG